MMINENFDGIGFQKNVKVEMRFPDKPGERTLLGNYIQFQLITISYKDKSWRAALVNFTNKLALEIRIEHLQFKKFSLDYHRNEITGQATIHPMTSHDRMQKTYIDLFGENNENLTDKEIEFIRKNKFN